MHDGGGQRERVLTAFQIVVLHNRLLLNLISSSAFKAYYDMLVSTYGENILLPNHRLTQVYRNFLSTLRPNSSLRPNNSTETDEDARDVDVNPDVQQEEAAEEEAEEEEAEEEVEEEEEEEVKDTSSYFRFLKTLVVHFTAKRTLERQSLRMKDEEIIISLFSVDRSPLIIPVGSWSTMEDMMRELFSSTETDTAIATKAIEILRDRISNLESKDDSKFGILLRDFKHLVDNISPILLGGGLHCETVLATLSKYFEFLLGSKGDDNENLTLICKVLLLFTCLVVLSEHLSLEAT